MNAQLASPGSSNRVNRGRIRVIVAKPPLVSHRWIVSIRKLRMSND